MHLQLKMKIIPFCIIIYCSVAVITILYYVFLTDSRHPNRPHMMYGSPQYTPHYPNSMPVSSVDTSILRPPGNITDDQRHGHMVAPPMNTSVICHTSITGLPNRYGIVMWLCESVNLFLRYISAWYYSFEKIKEFLNCLWKLNSWLPNMWHIPP